MADGIQPPGAASGTPPRATPATDDARAGAVTVVTAAPAGAPAEAPAPPLTRAGLEHALSAERLAAFGTPGDDDVTVLARYAWNQAMVDAFGFPLHLLEVSLRNAVDGAGRQVAGAPKRHGGVPSWLDAQPPVLDAPHAATTAAARDALRARGAPRTPGRLIAELTFGFWVQLFNGYYDQGAGRRGRPGLALWTPAVLRAAFPSAPARERDREHLRARLDGIRLFRNRLSHHEPVFNRDPARWYRDVAATVRWLSVPAYTYLAAFDTTPTVLAAGHAPYLARCRALLGAADPEAEAEEGDPAELASP